MMDGERLRIGYIPLVDAAALVVAADAGFAHTEGLDIELVRSRAPGPTNRSTASGSLPAGRFIRIIFSTARASDVDAVRCMRAHQSAQFLRCTIISQSTVLVRD